MKTKALPDGLSLYITLDGDLVDKIAFDHYGTHDGTTEILYEDNPHLLSFGMILPAGAKVRLRPRQVEKRVRPSISLWD